jgi:hypothetical protein
MRKMFDLMPTRSYFFLFLINLKILEQFGLRTAIRKRCRKIPYWKLTLLSGTGDALNWYVVYADASTNLVQKSILYCYLKQTRGSRRIAIQYLEYSKIEGIPIATKWIFWGWKKGQGLTDELGHATLTNIKFVNVTKDYFAGPDFKTK